MKPGLLPLCILGGLLSVNAGPLAGAEPAEWPYYGGSIGFSRYSSLDLINPENVRGLKILWERPAIDPKLTERYPDLTAGDYFRSTPIEIGGVLYAPNGAGLVEAFDAQTGRTLWAQQPFSDRVSDLAGTSTRGVAYWRDGADARIISVRGEYLYCLNAATGKPVVSFGNKGRIFLRRLRRGNDRFFMSGGPLVVGNVIVIGGMGSGERSNDGGDQKKGIPEAVRAYDVRSGAKIWEFSPVPVQGDPARSTWGGGSAELAGAMGAYGTFSADPDLGYIYVPFSAPNPPTWGGWRPGNNEYGDSIVALDVKTGKKIWSFQTLHHDLWDHDLSAPPVLGDITVNGRKIKAVMVAGKQAVLFTLDRVTGAPVWPIVERAVPQSSAPGEHSAPTQPFPTKPAPLDRQGVTPDDLIDFTPELRREALELIKNYTNGPAYTPPSVYTFKEGVGGNKGTLTLPGTDGGANWNTGAFDPETQTYYALTVTTPAAYALEKPPAPDADVDYITREQGLWMVWGPHGLPLTKPPYGRITAVNMNTGEFSWVIANGDGPRNHPLLKDLHLPPLGGTGRAALVITKTLVFAGESSDAVWMGSETKGFGKYFRAYDKTHGEELARLELPAGTTGAPITYAVHGKQYVLVAIAGMGHAPEWIALGL
jgi:quinoprotein glucose dehydrogenase